MKMPKQKSERGFTLMELMVAIAVGLIVMGAMTSLFKTGIGSAMLVTQRAATQQNMRAAIDLMVKDISMAGAGLPSGGIQLPAGSGSNPSLFGCDQSGACHVPGDTYPTSNYMYGIIPGYSNGVEASAVVAAAPPPAINDSITSIYADYNFPLWEYDITFPVPGNGNAIALTPNVAYVPAPPFPNAAGGIQVHDLSARCQPEQSARGWRFAQPDAKDQHRGHGAKHAPAREIPEPLSGHFGQRPQHGISQSLSVTSFRAGDEPMGQGKNNSPGFT